jgi:hypothetical protein
MSNYKITPTQSSNIKNVFNLMTYKDDFMNNSGLLDSKKNKSPNVDPTNLNNFNNEINAIRSYSIFLYKNVENKNKKVYLKRKIKDLVEIRRKKLREMYEIEEANLELEIKGKIKTANTHKKQEEKSHIQSSNKTGNKNNHVKNENPTPMKENTSSLNNYCPNYNFSANNQLNPIDSSLNAFYNNYENLKLEDFYSKKKLNDILLQKITKQIENLQYTMNDKSYQEKMAMERDKIN